MSGIVSQNTGRRSGLVKAVAAGGGEWTLISAATASGDDNIAFTGLDSTYDAYCFKFINIHPETDDKFFQFNGSDDASSHSYDITKTTTFFEVYHSEGDSVSGPSYTTSFDLAQASGYQRMFNGIGNDNDQSASGELWLFSPASTTFVKHFLGRINGNRWNDAHSEYYFAGYFNTTSAITAINFQNDSGAIDLGTIALYGIG